MIPVLFPCFKYACTYNCHLRRNLRETIEMFTVVLSGGDIREGIFWSFSNFL